MERPWVIANQYLVVQKWKPNFVPGYENIQCMPIWVRLSKLPMKWIDSELLWNIRGMLGTTCKVDPITAAQARGRFARISMEIDISKPPKGALNIDSRVIKEGIVETQAEMDMNQPSDTVEKSLFGPWLLVSYGSKYGRKGNGGAGNIDKAAHMGRMSGRGVQTAKTGQENPSMVGESGNGTVENSAKYRNKGGKSNKLANDKVGGSRFTVLSEEIDEVVNDATCKQNKVDDSQKRLDPKKNDVLKDITNKTGSCAQLGEQSKKPQNAKKGVIGVKTIKKHSNYQESVAARGGSLSISGGKGKQ
ncbi:hypothetical protein Ddye_012980 [Dipteronia dyeriana]|uniref:DUF4283 domain-containing protein n=1 Tax=Dipteronia dyeriana TaxID=168575 RepID=A0AAE0CJ71_9ROSI|nr:hypothetical protein Ddye_012980 [Dipteronia dyeriana]